MSNYNGNLTGNEVGVLPVDPVHYYWWEAGGMWGTMINYWYLTGDESYVQTTSDAIVSQAAPHEDFMMPDRNSEMGNDDQGFWGMTAMGAAEAKFPNPPSTQPQWLALAQGVFNTMSSRWDMSSCGGGLRWQVVRYTPFKNTVANGCLFNIASRLGKYTGNQTYIDWAEKVWDWSTGVGNITPDYIIYDGADFNDQGLNCTNQKTDHSQLWSYNYGIYLHGAASMYNMTNGDPKWQARVAGILATTLATFFDKNTGIMIEPYLQNAQATSTDLDELSFRAYLARWLGATAIIAPFTHDAIMAKLQTSAVAAAKTCIGGTHGTSCNSYWLGGATWPPIYGVGQQMAALEVIQANLIKTSVGPANNATGISQGNADAGADDPGTLIVFSPITTADRVEAVLLTIVSSLLACVTLWFLVVE